MSDEIDWARGLGGIALLIALVWLLFTIHEDRTSDD